MQAGLALSRDTCNFLSYGHQTHTIWDFQRSLQNKGDRVESLPRTAINQRWNEGFGLQNWEKLGSVLAIFY